MEDVDISDEMVEHAARPAANVIEGESVNLLLIYFVVEDNNILCAGVDTLNQG